MGSFTASTVAHEIARQPAELLAIKMGITKIWAGDNVVLKTDGYCYSAYATGAAGDQFVGVAAETKDNRYTVEGDSASAAATAGDRSIACWQNGIIDRDYPAADAAIETDLGLAVYCAVGTATADTPRSVIKSTAGKETACGKIVGIISASLVRVVIQPWGAVET
jgi:hypothetical protein